MLSVEPCQCRNYACVDSYAIAFQLVSGHHPHCSERRERRLTSTEVIEGLVAIIERDRAEIERLTKQAEAS